MLKKNDAGRGVLAVLMMVVLGLVACTDDADPEAGGLNCGEARSSDIDGVAVCIIDNDLLVETGFECPENLEVYEGDSVTICAEGELNESQLGGVEGFNEIPDEPNPNPDPNTGNDPIELEVSPITEGMCVNVGEEPEGMPALSVEQGDGGTVLFIEHTFEENCCTTFSAANAQLDEAESTITLSYDFDDSNPCDCTCFHTFDYSIIDVPVGTYQVQIGEQSVEISVQ